MNSKKNENEVVPHGWIICSSKSNPGKKYYFNKKTGKSSWTCPKPENVQGTTINREKEKASSSANSKELAKKSLKRKSTTSTQDATTKKKNKPETSLQKAGTIGHNSHIKKSSSQGNIKNAQVSNKKSPNSVKPTRPRTSSNSSNTSTYNNAGTSKNSANNRLSQLRSRLSSEAQNEETNESPRKKSCSSTETSENSRSKDSKSVTSESPISETLPHSSQFLTVNKIISSIKAQLPERYNSDVKPKDTFADIEERICSQVAEYTTKHPATPPQFTEASKIVSAIKSKLCKTPNVVREEEDVKTFKSANERLSALRASLNCEVNQLDTSKDNNIKKANSCEAMEVEYAEQKPARSVTDIQSESRQPIGDNNRNLVLVVDTNIFIHQLDCIRNVLNSHVKGYKEQPTLLVPWRVINELDRLKDNNNGNGAICKRAKAAMDYLYKSLPENTSIKGQSLRDANSHIYPCEIPDDEILNCCLQQLERGKAVILLSHDKNLCNKATINKIRCMDVEQLKGMLESKIQPSADPELYASVKHYQSAMYSLLANILENEMRAKFNELWLHVLFKAPPWTLTDVLQCLLKHWIAVFNEVFPRIEHLIADLKNSMIYLEAKEPRSLTQSEVSNFLELCLDVAKKCQIIPEYMELAKLTVDRLQRGRSEREDEVERDGETPVIEAFEKLWTVFSGYCAKLSSGLGVPHNIEDKLSCNDTLDTLVSKWSIYSAQIRCFARAIQSISDANEESPSEDKLRQLESVFKDSLALICADTTPINIHNIKTFYVKCRNMFHEASVKFSQLTELLSLCEDKIQ